MARFGAAMLIAGAVLLASAPAEARYRYSVPEPGDTSLEAKCRSEASMIGGGGGRGAANRFESVRQMRVEYRRKCMHGG